MTRFEADVSIKGRDGSVRVRLNGAGETFMFYDSGSSIPLAHQLSGDEDAAQMSSTLSTLKGTDVKVYGTTAKDGHLCDWYKGELESARLFEINEMDRGKI